MVDERFAFITHTDGETKFQVLLYNEEGTPIDWDMESTEAVYKQYLTEHGGT